MEGSQLVRLFHGNTKSLKLVGKSLKTVPKPIGHLNSLVLLELKNNRLDDLPEFIAHLVKLQHLNLGNNCFTDLPTVLEHMVQLRTLHIFRNFLTRLDSTTLSKMRCISSLNLNNNQITELPPEICNLASLELLSIDGNRLSQLPVELCSLGNLIELRASNNELQALPLEIGFLRNIVKMHLSQNKIKELPEGLGRLQRLRVLDVAGNELRIFPTETHNIPLRELYCEANPLLEKLPVHSVQEEEVLSLKELAARLVMKEVKDKSSPVRRMIMYFPGIRDMLSQASKCAVCSEAFLNTWLECVKFVKAKQDLKIGKCKNEMIPIRSLLCSYKCFNSEGHSFYGVAFP